MVLSEAVALYEQSGFWPSQEKHPASRVDQTWELDLQEGDLLSIGTTVMFFGMRRILLSLAVLETGNASSHAIFLSLTKP